MTSALSTRVGRLALKNPVMTGSGCFGYGLEAADVFDVGRLGALVLKTLTTKGRHGNPPPRIAETAAGMLNAIGLENPGIEAFLSGILPKVRAFGCPVVASVAGRDMDDYVALVEALQVRGIHAIELNLSCPNLNSGGMDFGKDPAFIRALLRRCAKISAKRDLWAKLTPHVADIRVPAEAAWKAGAAALTVANTYVGMAVDWRTGRPRLARGTGGLSGPAVKPLTLALVAKVASQIEAPIVASGGILTAEDALEYAAAGASAVQVGTASFRDPAACLKLIEALPGRLARAGLGSWTDGIGRTRSCPSAPRETL